MKIFLAKLVALVCGGALAGTCTYSFDWFCNESVADFPVPLALEEGVDGFTYTGFADAAGGSDLRISDGSANLPYEIESWNPGGRSIVWVTVPSFSKATALTLTWGDASAAAAAGNVWDAQTLAVFHCAGTPTKESVQGLVSDADGNAAATEDSGLVGAAASFVGVNTMTRRFSAVSSAAYGDVTNVFTVSCWTRVENEKANTYLAQVRPGTQQLALICNYAGARVVTFYASAGIYTGTSLYDAAYGVTLPDDGWHHVAFAYDGTTLRGYVDGYEKLSKTVTFSWKTWTGTAQAVLGGSYYGDPLTGALDEFRVARVARSAAWIRAAAETQAKTIAGRSARLPVPAWSGSGTLTNFPVFVQLDRNTAGNGDLVLSAAATARTLRIRSDETGAALPYEVQFARDDAFYDAAGLWVTLDRYPAAGTTLTLRETVPTFDCYRATASTPAVVSVDPVWTTNDYLLVYHLNPTGAVTDCVHGLKVPPRYLHGTDNHAMAYPRTVTSPFGPYQGISCRTNAGLSAASVTIDRPLTNQFTISWWGRCDEVGTHKPNTYLFSFFGYDVISGLGYDGTYGNASCWFFNLSNGPSINGRIDLGTDGVWHHYAVTGDGKTFRTYTDGLETRAVASTANFGFSSGISGKPLRIGSSANTIKDAFIGRLAEVRVETVARDARWIAAAAQQRAYRDDGTPRTAAPHFAGALAATGRVGEVAFAGELVGRAAADVLLCWGTSDAGKSLAGWDHVVALGTKNEGSVAHTLTGIAADTAVVARLVATNVYGAAWTDAARTVTVNPRPGTWIDITVSDAGAETLADFPLCVRFPARCSLPADPKQVRFLTADGTSLAWEWETWNPADESVVWVRVPSLASGTRIRACWRADGAQLADWSAADVWSAEAYARVFHCAASRKGNKTDDASPLGVHITGNGVGATVTNGVVGSCLAFRPTAATNGTVNDGAGGPLNDFPRGFTYSFWANIVPNAVWDGKGRGYILKTELAAGRADKRYSQIIIRTASVDQTVKDVMFQVYNFGSAAFAPSWETYAVTNGISAFEQGSRIPRPASAGWHHYGFTHDGDWLRTYCDGAAVGQLYYPLNLNESFPTDVKMKICLASNTANYDFFTGDLDEIRIERVGRSAAWIAASYANQRADSTFVHLGPTTIPGTLITLR